MNFIGIGRFYYFRIYLSDQMKYLHDVFGKKTLQNSSVHEQKTKMTPGEVLRSANPDHANANILNSEDIQSLHPLQRHFLISAF